MNARRTLARPKLVTFGGSLFCEKARWALDWHGIAYQEICWAPGVHQLLAKRYGAKGSTLPILLDGETVVQTSSAIIDWADEKTRDPSRKLTSAEAIKIEEHADDVIGVNVRRLTYAEMLLGLPHLAKPSLFYKTSLSHRIVGNMIWPMSRRVIMRKYSITPDAAAESRSKLEAELDLLDAKLADGRAYLIEDRFSRADLAVASLLARFACREEIPAFRGQQFPDALLADMRRWRGRPVMRWVKGLYEAHRTPARHA
jgi:glutathione S-transferase